MIDLYNASAGTGKTHRIIESFLLLLLKNHLNYRRTLAITFTKKATAQLKERILEELLNLSIDQDSEMILSLVDHTGLPFRAVREKAREIAQQILHDYGRFEISTIDSFTTRIVHSFRYHFDLIDYELTLDETEHRERTMSIFYQKASRPPYTHFVKLYAQDYLHKEDASLGGWKSGFESLMQEMNKDQNYERIKEVINSITESKSALVESIPRVISKIEKEIEENIADFVARYQEYANNGELRKTFYNKIKNLGDYKYRTERYTYDETSPALFNNKKSPELEAQEEYIIERYNYLQTLASKWQLLQNLRKYVYVYPLLELMSECMKEAENELKIKTLRDYNHMLYEEVKDEYAPFVYYRVGNRYAHYFIDEFQDTSVIQLENLKPLMNEGLSRGGKTTLVYDLKQCLYQWRNSDLQVIFDFETNNPLPYSKEIHTLNTNYRSKRTIVEFNGSFYPHIAPILLGEHPFVKKFTDEANIKTNPENDGEGYVEVWFMKKDRHNSPLLEKQLNKMLKTLRELEAENVPYGDVMILVRTNNQQAITGEFLEENHVPVSTNEQRLINDHPMVQLIVSYFEMNVSHRSREHYYRFYFALKSLLSSQNTNDVEVLNSELIENYLSYTHVMDVDTFIEVVGLAMDKTINLKPLSRNVSLYHTAERLLREFSLIDAVDENTLEFLDYISTYPQSFDMKKFVSDWSIEKTQKKASSPEKTDAVQILTYHRAKGLQAPVVLLPYMDFEYMKSGERMWVDDLHHAFGTDMPSQPLLINYNEKAHAAPFTRDACQKFKHHKYIESLDILYVATTRAKERMYVYVPFYIPKGKAKDASPKRISELWKHFFEHQFGSFELQKENNERQNGEESEEEKDVVFAYGKKVSLETEKNESDENKSQVSINGYEKSKPMIYSFKVSDFSSEAIRRGELLHTMMESVEQLEDIESVASQLVIGDTGLRTWLHDSTHHIISHPQLCTYYDTTKYMVRKEAEFCAVFEGTIHTLRPDHMATSHTDRISTTLIDYKTGEESQDHHRQMKRYKKVVEESGFEVVNMFLVYIDHNARVSVCHL